MEGPANTNHPIIEFLNDSFEFLVKNFLGIAPIIFGVTTEYYIMNQKYKRITKFMCWMSVFINGTAGSIAWVVVKDLPIPDFQKAVICGFTPIIIKPLAIRVVIWIDPVVDAIGGAIKRFFTNKNK